MCWSCAPPMLPVHGQRSWLDQASGYQDERGGYAAPFPFGGWPRTSLPALELCIGCGIVKGKTST